MGKLGSSSGVAPYQLPTSFAARFEQRFSIEMQLRQRAQRRIGRLSPEAALGRFEQAFGHRVERPRIAGGQKTPDTWVKRICLRDIFIHPIVENIGGCVITELIVYRRIAFKAAFVSVPLDAREPFGIDHPRAEHAQRFLPQIAYLGTGGVMRVAEIVTRAAAGEAVNRCDHAAMKLEIVIAIEEVMFTVVLIMQRDVDTSEPCAKCFVRLDAIFVARIYITPPFKIGAREVVAALPVLSLNQRQDASAITAW